MDEYKYDVDFDQDEYISSYYIAKKMERRHDNIMRDIKKRLEGMEDHYFITKVLNEYNKKIDTIVIDRELFKDWILSCRFLLNGKYGNQEDLRRIYEEYFEYMYESEIYEDMEDDEEYYDDEW